MNVNFNYVHFSSICEGCLSLDRELKPVNDAETKRFFQSIIEPSVIYNNAQAQSEHRLALCWECTATIRRMLRYQRQVQDAHNYLVNYKFHYSTTLPCLSSLTTQMILPEISIKIDEVDLPLEVTRQTAKAEVECTEPLTFIKVEEPDDDMQADVAGSFMDDDSAEVEDKLVQTVLKADPFNYKEEKSKTKRSKKKTKEEFDDSDDEPLKKSAGEKEIETDEKLPEERKKRGRRKKKEDSAAPVKKRGGRRENPAGVVDNERVARKLARLSVPPGRLQMLLLSWTQVEEERQKALASEAYLRHDHRCESCAVGFNHTSKLQNHMKKHDPSSGELVCSACGIRCKDQHALSAHRRRHRVRWRCVSCGGLWSRAEVAADHCARAHRAPVPTHACALCGHVALTLGKLRNHMKNHSERQKCELCGKSFRDRASLRTHLFIHRGEKEYACPRCGKQFLFKKAMQLHMVTHDAPALLYCHQCDVNFKNRMSFYQHMKYNLKHIDPAKLKYRCGVCEKRFAKAGRLREHHLAVHLRATPVRCAAPACAFACASRPVLRTHMRMVHRNVRAARNHVCHTCGKAYATKKTLEGHMRSHTGERPFACAVCAATFAYEAALYNHNRLVHLKHKPPRRAAPASEQTDPALPR